MLSAGAARRFEPRELWAFAAVWLLACAMFLAGGRTGIESTHFPDPDDALRLLEVRDWLAGQSWFDVTQYRMNAPDGAPMHWSRLVDLPLAATILLLRPFLEPQTAEVAAMVIVPLLTLGIVIALVGLLARRLVGGRFAVLALATTPFTVGAFNQLRPMRIDHHGWQIVLGLVAALALIDPKPRRSAIVAGAAIAAWLNISVEALPIAAALGALFALRWLQDAAAAERLRAYVASFAGTSLILFAATRAPSLWAERACDAVSAAHLAAFGAAALGCLAAVRPNVASVWVRIAVLGGCGAVALAAMLATDSQCARDPFATLDPLVREYWYERVDEGLPLWHQSAVSASALIALPLIGLLGAWIARSRAAGDDRTLWENYFFLLAAATLAGVLVLRSGGYSNILAVPGAAFFCSVAVAWAQALRLSPARIIATAAAFLTVVPAYPIAVTAQITGVKKELSSRMKVRIEESEICFSDDELGRLRALPTGDIAAPLDLGPAILVHSPHRIIASGHHRNEAGMRDVIRLFTAPAEDAAAIVAARGIDYFAVCPQLLEPRHYATENPDGLWAAVAAGHLPDWLEPVAVPGTQVIRVWRVRADRLPPRAGTVPPRS
jgi:hypothetical protein